MYIQSNLQVEDEARAIVDVKISYDAVQNDQHLYRVTLDKITGAATVHHEGETKRTRVEFQDPDDRAELEERAVLCCIHFPGAA